jgi:hypothetical protein
MIDAAAGLIHPKTAKRFKHYFEGVNKIGSEIRKEKHARKARRTWKDGTSSTMYLS